MASRGGEKFLSEKEIQNMLKLVVEAREKTEKIEHEIEVLRNTHKAMKMANDERMHNIQKENEQLDDQLKEKESQLYKTKEEIETKIYGIKAKLLRRITLCNLKNLLKEASTVEVPEDALSTIYVGQFCAVYDEITIGSKPVNQYEWIVRVELSKHSSLRGLLERVWRTYNEIHWGWREEGSRFYQRDFNSEEKAKAYGERNRARICEELIEDIKRVEQETEKANDNIDEVFDFRLLGSILNPNYSQSSKFRIVLTKKHELTLSPVITIYNREVEKIEPYVITAKQQGYKLTISGHRFSRHARDINYAIRNYFNTDFKAIEADTKQEISARVY